MQYRKNLVNFTSLIYELEAEKLPIYVNILSVRNPLKAGKLISISGPESQRF